MDSPRRWWALAVLALPTTLLALDLSVLYLAVPRLSADLRPSGGELLWIIDVYGFMVAGFLITMGTLGDRIGRRRLLLVGAAAFGLASVLAAYSQTAAMLIAARALMGVAGATLAPSTLALITNLFRDPRQRAFAIGVSVSCFMGGAAIGPLVGGALLARFWWGSVFLLGVPVMLLLLVLGPILLPEYRDPDAGRIDLASVVLSLLAVLPIVYGVKSLAVTGPGAVPFAALAAGVVAGAVFLRRQRRLDSPLLPPKLFRDRGFSGSLVILALGVATQGGVMLLVGQYLQSVLGMSPLRAGLWTLPGSPAMIAGALLAPVLARRVHPRSVVAGAWPSPRPGTSC